MQKIIYDKSNNHSYGFNQCGKFREFMRKLGAEEIDLRHSIILVCRHEYEIYSLKDVVVKCKYNITSMNCEGAKIELTGSPENISDVEKIILEEINKTEN